MPDKTALLYLKEPDRTQERARIVSRRDLADGRFAFTTNETIFYPASGGQPSDTGKVSSPDGLVIACVEQVTISDGVVEHVARALHGVFEAGDEVAMTVDEETRSEHSRLHSAGELICCAVRNLGHGWSVSGASHYPGQARVVYDIALPESARRTLQEALSVELDRLISRNDRVRIIETFDRVEATRLVGFTPDYVPMDEPIRIVFMTDGLGRPCCGTHVTQVREIGGIAIRNIRAKKGQTSIGYEITKETTT